MGLGRGDRETSGVRSYLRPRGVSAPHGTVPVSGWSISGDTSVALEYLRPPMWGDRDRLQQGGCPEKPATMHGLELSPHAYGCLGETPGNGEHTKIQQKRKVVPDRRCLPSISGGRCFPPVGYLGSWVGLPGKPWRKVMA
jgi:hypothetical protein